ncbi:hypothetical protein AMS68_004288 [Peltaster fructicola]|uniref:Phosphoglucomutase n=1 Tax=Peltaster fructicola TaxID=286661 RepID=A0A6H0XVT5_9PEZI|nr:hypothetical protein AMS68_004288 [Peltaster fructicola]
MSTTQELATEWLRLDKDESTRKEIQNLLDSNDEVELEARLRKRIAFGTAGLRSSMKAGFAHMNSLTVLQASHGLANYALQSTSSKAPSVVLAYDARHNSEKFARLAAAAFLSKGFRVFWFGQHVHTPMVPFVVSRYGADVGVMVTASHNPKNDNGYKVYWSNGCQIIPPLDAGIATAIEQVTDIDTWDTSIVDTHNHVENIYESATKAYLSSLYKLSGSSADPDYVRPFTYTPMHGVGLPFLLPSAHELGYTGDSLRIVSAQAEPDPDFSTVPFPNPEEKGALDLAIQDAEQYGTSVILANDPDADRFAVATQIEAGRWHQFTGNEMGALLASFVLDTYQGDKSRLVMLASTVSSRMLAAMAEKEGFQCRETLTGFKWLGNVARDLKNQGLVPVFAYEEAIGYMFPSVVWDKDGIAAATIFLTAWQGWAKKNITPFEKLQQLYRKYGFFADSNTYLISPSPDVTSKVFASIRSLWNGKPPGQVGRRKVLRWRDLTVGFDSASPDGKPDLPVDASAQMITCELHDVVFTARGSGTEPKIKLYIEASAGSHEEAKRIADEVLADLLREWFPQSFGLHLAGSS